VRSLDTVIIKRAARALAVFVAASALALPAYAHKTRVTRMLMIEPADGGELQVIIALKVPSGDARRALEVYVDVDRDGRLGEGEMRELEAMLISRALDGIAIHTETSTLTLGGLEVKTKADPRDGPLEVMVHAVAVLPNKERSLAVTTSSLGDPLDLVVLPGVRPVVHTMRGRAAKGGFTASLGRGDRVGWHIR
jgi:hypothetical protein